MQTREHAWPTLWLPLFLVWPLLFLLLVLWALVVLPIAIALNPRQPSRAFELAGAPVFVICNLRGLHVDVAEGRDQILISFH